VGLVESFADAGMILSIVVRDHERYGPICATGDEPGRRTYRRLELLLHDPLVELRLIGLGVAAAAPPLVGGLLPAQTMSDMTHDLALFDTDLVVTGVDSVYHAAAANLVASGVQVGVAGGGQGEVQSSLNSPETKDGFYLCVAACAFRDQISRTER
jgi:hypothetical protein